MYCLVFCLVVSVIYCFRPQYDFSMKGIALPLKPAVVPSDIQGIRFFPFPPVTYRALGTINIEQHFSGKGQITPAKIERYAKKLAANLGANAVIITAFGHTSLSTAGPAQGLYVFRGVAARVPEEVKKNNES